MPEHRAGLRNYTRWTRLAGGQLEGVLRADILHGPDVYADPKTGTVEYAELCLSPDEARLVGVRLIEAAALADGDRAVRSAPTP